MAAIRTAPLLVAMEVVAMVVGFQEAVTVVGTEYLTATVFPLPLRRSITGTEAKNMEHTQEGPFLAVQLDFP